MQDYFHSQLAKMFSSVLKPSQPLTASIALYLSSHFHSIRSTRPFISLKWEGLSTGDYAKVAHPSCGIISVK